MQLVYPSCPREARELFFRVTAPSKSPPRLVPKYDGMTSVAVIQMPYALDHELERFCSSKESGMLMQKGITDRVEAQNTTIEN